VNPDDYASVHGPTVGDTVALGDTGLVVRVEADSQLRGEEFLLGFGKTARDGMHLAAISLRDTCDLVVSNVVILDPLLGVRKASIGIR
jgi:urease subunit alpha